MHQGPKKWRANASGSRHLAGLRCSNRNKRRHTQHDAKFLFYTGTGTAKEQKISASTPFAGKAFDVRVDGTYATALSSDILQDELQRKLGLWLSAALPTLRVALERGMPVDFFGDYLSQQGPPPAAPRRRPRRLGGRDARPGQRAGRAR